jgi:hypothetical protein
MGRPTMDITQYPTNCRINGMPVGVARLGEVWFMSLHLRFLATFPAPAGALGCLQQAMCRAI